MRYCLHLLQLPIFSDSGEQLGLPSNQFLFYFFLLAICFGLVERFEGIVACPCRDHMAIINYVSMKGRQKRNKGSLQKNSSAVLQLHTQRHSLISSLPHHDSILSIRPSSRFPRNSHAQSDRNITANIPGQVAKTEHVIYRKCLKPKSKEKKHTLMSLCSQKSTRLLSSACTEPMHSCPKSQEGKQSSLTEIIKRNTTLLEQYKIYTQQLKNDCSRYKEKYRQVLQKLRKYEPK